MEYTKLISVIIPTYNREKTILRAVNSVLNQTYSNIELIVIDDCSNDNTEEVLKNLNDKRLMYYKNNKNIGANAARNLGINLAKGEYIAFHDSDDVWHLNKLEKQMNLLQSSKEEVALVYCGIHYAGKRDQCDCPDRTVSQFERTKGIHEFLLQKNIITTAAILCKKDKLVECGMFDEELPRLQDWELVLRMSKSYRFEYVDESLVDVYLSENSITHNWVAYVYARCRIIKKNIEEFQNNSILIKSIFEIVVMVLKCATRKEETEKYVNYVYECFRNELDHIGIGKKELYAFVPLGRNEYYYNLSCAWFNEAIDRQNKFSQRENVVIYGLGNFGENLLKQLYNENVNVVAIIDNSIKKVGNEQVFSLDEFKKEYKKLSFDTIVVTPMYEYSIIEKILLQELENVRVVSLEEYIMK